MSTAIRMTARSVVLSVLLGAHPASATTAELLRLTADFDIRESTLRVALTRMVAAGDLVRSRDGYRLSDRLLARQRRQDDALDPSIRDWNGSWVVVIVTAVGADARTRAGLRTTLWANRFGELREGVWLRPDNLYVAMPEQTRDLVRMLTAHDPDDAELAAQLWDLTGWSATGHRLVAEMEAADGIPARFCIAAAMVRHLLTDPVLPADLLPPDWPGQRLRDRYAEFVSLLLQRRDHTNQEALR